MAANQIPNLSDDAELNRLEKLSASYQSRVAELCIERDKLAMVDEAANVVSRAQALAAGAEYQPLRSAEAISDEIAVLRGAVERVSAQAVDARSAAVVRITRDAKLHERAAETRAQVALKCQELLAALDASRELAEQMENAGLSATAERWTGCAEASLVESLAGLQIDCGGIDAEAMRSLERRASRRVEPAFEMRDRPAPAAKPSIRKRAAEVLGELMG